MAVLNSIQELEEDTPGQFVVSNVMAAFSDVGEEISFRAVFHDHEGAIGGFHNLDQGHNVGMRAGLQVEGNFSLLESFLSGIQSILCQGLDGK
jgi:hypothetical protein